MKLLLLLAPLIFTPYAFGNPKPKIGVYDFDKVVHTKKRPADEVWRELVSSEKPTVIRVIGEDCPACEESEPIYRAAAQELNGKVRFYDINFAGNRDLLRSLNVKKVPTVLLTGYGSVHVHKGHVIERKTLFASISEYLHIRDLSRN